MLVGKYIRTKEIREKARQAHLGMKLSEETKRKISKSLYRIKFRHSEEHKRKMSRKYMGKGNPAWKGGRQIDFQKYVLIYMPQHPFCQKRRFVKEHRLVMEKAIGRYLKPFEQVHHINEIRNDNRIENLILFKNNGFHMSFHRLKGKTKRGIIFPNLNTPISQHPIC